MSLDEYIDYSDEKEVEYCPECGEPGEHMRNNQWDCSNPDCDTLSWFAVSGGN